jgi:hypothetical protein
MPLLCYTKSASAASPTPFVQRYHSQAKFAETDTDPQGYSAQNTLHMLNYSRPATPAESAMALAAQFPTLVHRCVLSVCCYSFLPLVVLSTGVLLLHLFAEVYDLSVLVFDATLAPCPQRHAEGAVSFMESLSQCF